jgi:hypothetical protein
MADVTFDDKNNQKKTLSILATGAISTGANTIGTLPEASLVTNVYAIVTTADTDTNGSCTVDVKVGSTVVANEVAVDATGIASGTVAQTYFPTGGAITVVAGAVAPDGDGVMKLVIEYIETELTNGQYTD